MSRTVVLVYGLLAYVAALLASLYTIGFVTGLAVPKTINSGAAVPLTEAIAVDLLLIGLFAVQHSLMARQPFKRWWSRHVPAAIERSSYILFAGLALMLLFYAWQPIPVVVWQIDNPALAAAVFGLAALGWVLVFSSGLLSDHFEQFGLRQVFNHLAGRAMPVPRFRAPAVYRLVRHPTYLGFIIAFWAAPTMTVGHLLFAAAATTYIFVGIYLEERDLVALFGDEYRRYRARVSMLVPWRRSA